ncbi:MAG: prepilin peptidase [Chloroflexi bacterium]|nr:prepilin peptidase [Chloroflexota bacterium]
MAYSLLSLPGLLIAALFALLGLLVGAALNVLADDLPQHIRPQRPRCINCLTPRAPSGWLAMVRTLRGERCPSCDFPVRRRELWVEVGTALIFAALPFLLDRPADLLFGALYVALFILVIVTDLEHRLILHAVTFPGTLLGLLGSLFVSYNSLPMALLGAVTGFVFFFVLYWVGSRLLGAGALGFGDVTLATMIGAMTGFPLVLLALVLGILLGGLITALLLLTRRLTMRSYLAYGPFLAVAGIVAVVWAEGLLGWYLR